MFELSEALVSKILFAMENQSGEFALVCKDGGVSLVPFSELDFSDSASGVPPEDVYSIPKWFSSDGFNLLEEFADGLGDGDLKRTLRSVLANGRGVFKNYKNVLKDHAEAERHFRLFKASRMRSRVFRWYDSLRDSWGLPSVTEETRDSLNLADSFFALEGFDFAEYDFSADGKVVFERSGLVVEELISEYPGETGLFFSDLWNGNRSRILGGGDSGFVCRTSSGEFVGCALFRFSSRCPADARERAGFSTHSVLTTCFVGENFRGLGIARKLLSLCVSDLRRRGVSTFFIADSLIPRSIEKILTGLGFEKIRSAFVLRF